MSKAFRVSFAKHSIFLVVIGLENVDWRMLNVDENIDWRMWKFDWEFKITHSHIR